MENVVTAEAATGENDGALDVAALVRMFEDSEEATLEARGLAERDRDYYDNIQLTAEETAALKKRGQPPVIDNRIKTKVDYLVGLEKSQRIDPRALPRTPAHEEDADGASQALKYVADTNDYDAKRSAMWRNLLIEGAAGISVAVEPSTYRQGEFDIVLRRWPWDRMFYDPHSSENDFSDAGYIGGVIWMDHADALAQYPAPEQREIIEATLSQTGNLSETYDDKPKFRLWADSKRKRIRVCQIWIKRNEQWHFAEYTKGGILKSGQSPYVDDKGNSDCEMIFGSAYVDRENNRYGLVREMISLQDSINKRKSKSLHLLNTAQIVTEDGAVDDIEKVRREAARPDGVIVTNPGAVANGAFKFETRVDLAQSHFAILQEDKNAIDLKGPNATMMGDKAQGSSSASGRAIIASQQGGMIQLGDLLDHLRHIDRRVFRAIWNRIRQFWTAEKWVRTTDDERNVKWVGVNVDRNQIQMAMQQSPEMGEKIAGMVGNVAELDCDIIIDEVPDSTVPQIEQFQALAELKKFDTSNEIPFRAIVAAMPSLKDRQKFLTAMDEQAEKRGQQVQAQQELQMRGAVAEVSETEQSANLKAAQAQKALADAGAAGQQAPEAPQDNETQIKILELEQKAIEAARKLELERMKAELEAHTKLQIAEMEAQARRAEQSERIRSEERRAKETERNAQEKERGAEGESRAKSQSDSALAGALHAIAAAMSKSKKVVRDKDGRVAGVE